ncbi:hypothetical protein [Virgibacillus senegalensis]|uniref:hypothetical protein n=1 Tax=Virgibacillus senegalensis TaxID=1499679 RepID=UPI000B0E265C|nr:hypothetical protein [Virgibacillus senegalensis]
MNKKMLRSLGIVVFAVGYAIHIGEYIPNTVSWTVTIVGLVLVIASNFVKKEKPDR